MHFRNLIQINILKFTASVLISMFKREAEITDLSVRHVGLAFKGKKQHPPHVLDSEPGAGLKMSNM